MEGKILTRGTRSFELSTQSAIKELGEGNRPTAASRIDAALRALSLRPNPDYAGAVSHAIAALECLAGDITGDQSATLGGFIKRHPTLFGSLKNAIEGIWRYSCNEGARHGKEGREPERAEAELIVGLAATVVIYLNRTHPKI